MAELVAADAFAGLALPVEAGGCRLAALPPARRAVVTAARAGAARLTVGQWLVEGEGEVDVSDAFAGLALEGPDAAAVLARLVPLDLEAGGLPARTLMRHTPVLVAGSAERFALLVPRSYAADAVGDIVGAMRAVAARREAGDGR